MKKRICLILLLFIFGCSQSPKSNVNYISVGIGEEVTSLNPAFAFNLWEGSIAELLFAPPVKLHWDNNQGKLIADNILAKQHTWIDTHTLSITLKDSLKWSDGKPLTVDDVIYSLMFYSNKEINSKFYGLFNNYYTDESLQIDSAKTFVTVDKNKLLIKFNEEKNPGIIDIDYPVLPKHIYSQIPENEVETDTINLNPVTLGAFNLTEFVQSGKVVLKTNKELYPNSNDLTLTFKIIPSYQNRNLQFQRGEIDILPDLKLEDFPVISKNNDVKIGRIKGREFDYLGLMNTSVDKPALPNKFFGDKKVRKAIAYAINKKKLIEEYFYNEAEICTGPVSPIYFNDDSAQYFFHSEKKASQLLKEAGWNDSNKDGIMDKNGVEFKFNIQYSAGNTSKEFLATVIARDLQKVGIKAIPAPKNNKEFLDDLFTGKMNCWLAGWYMPVPVELKPYYYTHGEESIFNFQHYSSAKADKLIEGLNNLSGEALQNKLKLAQQTIYEDQPSVFLYWKNNLTAYKNNVKNIEFTPTGMLYNSWNWFKE